MVTIPEAFSIAFQHHQAGRLPEAEALYRQILQAQPGHPDALHSLGLIAHHVGQYDVAVDYISQAIQAQPSRADFFNNLGEAYRRLGRLDEALAAFQRAVALSPGLMPPISNIGVVLKQQGRLDEAAAHYREVLRLNPESADMHNNLGNVLQEQGNFEGALAQYRRAAALRPDCAEAHHNMAGAFYTQGKLEEAAGHYQQALAIKPDYVEASLWLGRVLQEQGRHEEAVACYQRALALGAANVDVFNNLGFALEFLGKQEEALAFYRRALEIKPDHAEAYYNLCNVLREQGRLEEAVRHYRCALAAAPAVLQHRDRLAEYLYNCGEWELAQLLVDEADSLQLRSPALAELKQAMHGQSSGRKIFCIGCNKTGTTSLGAALKSLGVKMGHQPRGEMLLEDWGRGDFTRIIAFCRTADAFRDIPFSLDHTYQALDASFPGARFILTIRDDPEQWYQSLIRYHTRNVNKGRLPTAEDLAAVTYRYRGFIWRHMQLAYGTSEKTLYDKDGLIAHYVNHNRDVTAYFSNRRDSLLVIKVGEADAMRRICEFVGVPWSGQGMPHLNRSR